MKMYMAAIISSLHHTVETFTEILMLVLETMGAVVIMYSGTMVFIRFFFLRHAEPCTEMRIRMARGIALGLEFYLAAEIFKTVTVRAFSDLYIIAIIVLLRSAMAVLIHWEMKHAMQALKEEHRIELDQHNRAAV